MPIPFTCPHCGASTEVAEEYAGQTGPCASCGKSITVPPLAGKMAPVSKEQGSLASLFIGLAVVGLVAMVLVALLLPAFQAPRGGRRPACQNNLKQIGLALHNYYDVYGRFPPAYLADEQGRPMHSWRVLILPFVEEQALYEQYDFDEPWDSPHNLDVARQMPSVFHCPDDWQAGPTDTSYFTLVGPGAFCEGATSTTFADITDGSSNTIAVMEMSGLAILWSEPQDLNVEEMGFTINDLAGLSPRSDHPGGVNVLFVDGSVHFISDGIPPERLKASITRAGGEAATALDY